MKEGYILGILLIVFIVIIIVILIITGINENREYQQDTLRVVKRLYKKNDDFKCYQVQYKNIFGKWKDIYDEYSCTEFKYKDDAIKYINDRVNARGKYYDIEEPFNKK